MTHSNLNIYFGPPGTGKTYKLLSLMESAIAAGIRPAEIAVLTFTRKAAEEAKIRAMEKFGLLDADLPWIRTIHSMVFARMGYRKQNVVGPDTLKVLGQKLGLDLSGRSWGEDGLDYGVGSGDKLVYLENLARVTGRGLEKVWQESDHDIDLRELTMFARAYTIHKKSAGLVDFTDMLDEFIATGTTPLLRTLFVDEAQDLSIMQWQAVDKIARGCDSVHVAGDDDQAIFRWAGADVETFLSLQGRVEVLDQSYRITSANYDLAMKVVGRIQHRKDKVFKPKAGGRGSLPYWLPDLEEVNLSAGTWLLLARNTYMLGELEDLCMDQGVNFDSPGKGPRKNALLKNIMTWESLRRGESVPVPDFSDVARFVATTDFSADGRRWARQLDAYRTVSMSELKAQGLKVDQQWFEALSLFPVEDREYFRSVRARGEKLLETPRVKVSTIHGVKGGQAENVLLLTDISYSAHEHMVREPDDETRVMYVGMTRSEQNLFIVPPRTDLYFEI